MSNADSEIPKFALYGENLPAFDDSIQPTLDLRSWTDVSKKERSTAFQQICNSGWLADTGAKQITGAIAHLNRVYLQKCPGKNYHSAPHRNVGYGSLDRATREAAAKDFKRIFLEEKEPLVLRMLSKFAELLIRAHDLERAKKAVDSDERKKHVGAAYETFDHFASCINHIFE